jgi:hypothetical protein
MLIVTITDLRRGAKEVVHQGVDILTIIMMLEINTKIVQQPHIALLTSSLEKWADAMVRSTRLPRRLGSSSWAAGLRGMNLTPKAIEGKENRKVIMGWGPDPWGLRNPGKYGIDLYSWRVYDSKELYIELQRIDSLSSELFLE